jgi:formylglycine-generating enzyme required for sulfatase activity
MDTRNNGYAFYWEQVRRWRALGWDWEDILVGHHRLERLQEKLDGWREDGHPGILVEEWQRIVEECRDEDEAAPEEEDEDADYGETDGEDTDAGEEEDEAQEEEEEEAQEEEEPTDDDGEEDFSEVEEDARPGEVRSLTLPGGARMEMVWCPPGQFTMGSPETEFGRRAEEVPHEVTLSSGFWMAKCPVTQAQWRSVMGDNPSFRRSDSCPVERVSWELCRDFCRMSGLALPTEAQWEYACRAGGMGAYGWDGRLGEMGWFLDNSNGMTHPVGQKTANAWGLQDMHGNVSEWCADWYGDYPAGAVTDPTGPESGTEHVCRGGNYDSGARYCRCASRATPVQMSKLGFRPVMTRPWKGKA